MKLTDLKVRNAKPRAKPYNLPDGRSLRLAIQPTGGKLWRGDYRFGRKQKTLAMGCYPDVSLDEARRRWDEARKLKARGIDPAAQRKADKHAKDDTFRAVGEELIAKLKREGRAHATLTKTRWLLGFGFAAFGEKRVAEITARDLLVLLRTVESRGLYETAGRLRGACGMVIRYAIATGRAERDPSADLRGALTTPVVSHRASVVDATAIGALLRAIDGFDGQPTTHAALRLAPYVFVRPGELRGAEWNEFDLDAAVWSIPATKMKMRRSHRVPLARQSLVILRDLQGLTGSGRFLFPSVRTVTRTISENTLNAALRRLGYGSEEMSTHGFRSMAATRLNEMGRWNPDAIERQLAHQEANAVRRAYTHAAEFWPGRVAMMQAWADHLDGLREGGKVLPLHAAR
jgi:integrase